MSGSSVDQRGAGVTPPGRPVSASARTWRWLRLLGLVVLAAVITPTGLSLVANALTRPPRTLDPGFGSYVQVGTSSVHYETWGTSGTPIVLVPGFLESTTAWSTVGPLLGEHHIVYALDLPGYGYTRYRGPMTLRAAAELVHGFIATLHLDKPILVGHSLGAAVIGDVALAHPDDVGRVIFADGDGLKIDLGPRWVRSLLLGSPYPTTLLRIGSRWTSVDQWLLGQVCGPHCPPLPTALVEQWVRPLHQRAGEDALHDLMVNSDYGLTSRQIAAITVPSAIIWGSDDHQGGSLGQTIANLHQPPVHLLQGAGHLTMIADPVGFAQAVEAS